jgi:hypothetical protein
MRNFTLFNGFEEVYPLVRTLIEWGIVKIIFGF